MTANLTHQRVSVTEIKLIDNSHTKKRDHVTTCNSCKQLKKHRGLGMCCACLRDYKRKTKPSYWLGTCYSEIKRRVNKFDPLRPNYKGLPICTKDQFMNKFVNDPEFLTHYKNWQNNNYQRKYAPSIDRIDNTKGYLLDNLRFISHSENSSKDAKLPLYCLELKMYFESQRAFSNYVGVSFATTNKAIKTGSVILGKYTVKYA